MKLSDIPDGKRVRIVGVENDEYTARKLFGLGVKPAALVKVVRRAPFGTPVEITAGGTRIAIGRGEADKITVENE